MLLPLLGLCLLALGGALVALGAARPHEGPPYLARLFPEADPEGAVRVEARPVDGPRSLAGPAAAAPPRYRVRAPGGRVHEVVRFRLLADGRAVADVRAEGGSSEPPSASAVPDRASGGPATLVLGQRDRAGTVRLELVAASFVEAPDASGAPLVTLELAEAAVWVAEGASP